MLEGAVKAGKRVRSETDISKGSVSISSAAAELSEIRSMQGESGERRGRGATFYGEDGAYGEDGMRDVRSHQRE